MDIFKKLNVQTEFIEEKVTFNPLLEKIYGKSKKFRSKKDQEILYKELKNLKYFTHLITTEKYGDLMYRSIIERMNIRQYRAGEAIYKARYYITSIIFILEGKVIVYKPFKKYYSKKSEGKKMGFIEKLLTSFKNQLSAKIDKIPDYYIEKGDEYGIKDVKSKNTKWKNTIETRSRVVVGELMISDYKLIFEKTEFLEKVDLNYFLNSLKIFNKFLNTPILEIITPYLIKKNFVKGEFLCRKNSPFENIFFIRNGSFQLYINSNVKIFNEFDLTFFDKKNQIESEKGNILINYEINSYYNDIFEYKIIDLEKGNIIGDIEFKYNLNNYLFDVQCDSDKGQVLYIKKEDFIKHTSENFKKFFNETIIEKLDYYKERIKGIKNVIKKRDDKQNHFTKIICDKINKNFGESIKKLEYKIQHPKIKNDKEFNKQDLKNINLNNQNNLRLYINDGNRMKYQSIINNTSNNISNYEKSIYSKSTLYTENLNFNKKNILPNLNKKTNTLMKSHNNNNNSINNSNNNSNNYNYNRPKSHYTFTSKNEIYNNSKLNLNNYDSESNDNFNKNKYYKYFHQDDSNIESSRYIPHIIKNKNMDFNYNKKTDKRTFLGLFGMNKNFYIKNNMSIISKNLNKILIDSNKNSSNK